MWQARATTGGFRAWRLAMNYNERHRSSRRPIELHIDKLVLVGFQPGDRYRIGEAVQSELSRLLTEQGIASTSAQSISIDRLTGERFSMSAGMSVLDQGRQIARTIHRAFERVGINDGCDLARNQSTRNNPYRGG